MNQNLATESTGDAIAARPRRARRTALGVGMLTAGVLAGGVLASTMSASADATPTPSTTTQSSDGSSSSAGSSGSTGSSGASGSAGTAGQQGQPGGRGGQNHGSAPVRSDEKEVTGTQAETLKAAALAKVPGGTVFRVETDAGDAAYEVHMTNASGAEVTVKFDKDLAFVAVEDGMGKGDPAPAGAQQGAPANGSGGAASGGAASGSSSAAGQQG